MNEHQFYYRIVSSSGIVIRYFKLESEAKEFLNHSNKRGFYGRMIEPGKWKGRW